MERCGGFLAARSVVVFGLLLSLCSGLPSASPTPTPCSAAPGYFCSGGSALICPVGAFCAGGAALNVSCYPVTACSVAGLSAQPPCNWLVTTLAGNGVNGNVDGSGTSAIFSGPIGIDFGADNALFVTDQGTNIVRRLTLAGAASTLAGSGSASYANGQGVAASFNGLVGVGHLPDTGALVIADFGNNKIRLVTLSGAVSTIAGGSGGYADGVGTAASFNTPHGIGVVNSSYFLVGDRFNNRVRLVSVGGAVSTLAGSNTAAWADGIGSSASFDQPMGLDVDLSVAYVADYGNHRIRRVSLVSGLVSTLCGSGAAVSLNGVGTNAGFFFPVDVAISRESLFVVEIGSGRVRQVDKVSAVVTTIAGSGNSYADGWGPFAAFNVPFSLTVVGGNLLVADQANHRIRQLSCGPCPMSYFCQSGFPVICPAGAFCPLSSVDPTPCPPGTWSSATGASSNSTCSLCSSGTLSAAVGAVSSATCLPCPAGSFCPLGSFNATQCSKGFFSAAGASSCTPCPAGTFTFSTGSSLCQPCPGGHYCPPGTSSWASLNCGKGNYCPDGSGAPTPCPHQVPPSGGWGALQVQGPAFLVETARCLNHCFWNFTSGDGMLSKC